MRFSLIYLALIVFNFEALAQADKPIRISDLIEIFEKSDFKKLVSLVHQLSYTVLDSSNLENGSLSYITKENKVDGNILSCNLNRDKKFVLLNFYTCDSLLSVDLKNQLIDQGFTTKGNNKFSVQGYLETQDFIKGNMEVAFGTKRKGINLVEYGFNILTL